MRFNIAFSFTALDQFAPLARAADEHGFHSVTCSDHVVHPRELKMPYPYTPDGSRRWEAFTDWPDPWVAIGAMAAVTTRLRFTTNIFVLPMRNVFGVAKSVATAAVMSNNRVAMGVGMGWSKDEFELLEQPFAQRGKRADEMLEVLGKLWAGGWVEHHGTFYDFDALEMSPAPSEPVPIYVGGLSDAALRRAANHDGWISDMHTSEELRGYVGKIAAYRAEAGRTMDGFTVLAACMDAFDLDGYKRLEEIGVTDILTLPWLFYHGPTDDLALRTDGIARFAEDNLSYWA